MLSEKKLFLFDIDGTIALGETLLSGARELFEHIKSIGGASLFITNNSTKSRKSYIEKFCKWNIETCENDFVTSSYASCLYLKENYQGKKIFALGTKSFIEELRSFSVNVSEEIEEDISAVIVAFDNEMTYNKAMNASVLLQRDNVDFLATNPDLRCPGTDGFIPDCGAICAMISATVGREPHYIGKPDRRIIDICLELTGFSPRETLVVGDRLYTDILSGINAGVETCLLLTGEATLADAEISDYKPDFIFTNIRELYNACI